MSSLESCIRKAGKALTKEDAKAIRAIRDDIVATKRDPNEDPNQLAVDEYLDILDLEKEAIMRQVEALGGTLANPKLSPSKFAQEAAKNIEEAGRKFPRKGIYRPETETAVIDYKTGKQKLESPENRRAAMRNMSAGGPNTDPFQRTLDLLTERTHRTVEMLYPDFYELTPKQVLAIVATFDEKAALGLAKQFSLVPKQARTLTNVKQVKAEMEFYEWSASTIADWIQKNETLPLYYKVDDAFERDNVEANPETPLSVTTKYDQVLKTAEEAAPGNIRKMMNWVVDKADMSIEAFLGAVPQSKLKDFMRYGLDAVKHYTKLVKDMDAWMNKIIEGHHALAKEWLAFNQSDKKGARLLGEFMHASSYAGVDVPGFKMPDAVALKKMNKQKRAVWAKRAEDYQKLKPFWAKLGKLGKEETYQQFTYDPVKDTMVPVGSPMAVSQAQKIYLNVRDAYMNQRTMLIFNLEKRIQETEADQAAKSALIAKLRKQFEAGQINPYFPFSRFGKYQAVAKDRETGETVAFIKRESRRARNDWMKEMRAQGWSVVPFEEQASDIEQMNKIDPGFVAGVTNLLVDTQIVDTEGKAISGTAVSDEIWQMYLRTLPEMSARKQYIHRIGRLGFTHDALRSFSDHSFHGTHQTAKLRFGHQLNEALKDIQENSVTLAQRGEKIRNWQDGERPKGLEDATLHEVLYDRVIDYKNLYSKEKMDRAPGESGVHQESHEIAMEKVLKEADHDGPWAVPMANEMVRRHNYNMNPKSSPWSTKLTAFGFLWFLSTSPAAGVLNLTQTAISAYPILRARFAGAGAGMELLKASKEYATAPTVDRIIAKLRGDESLAMQEFSNSGMFSKTRTRELMGLSEAGSTYSGRQEQILNFTGYIFHKTEEMNRAVTALAAYRLARKKGMSHVQAIEQADELVEMSHYDYTNTNRPRFMQGDMGRVVFLFRNYSLNMQYRLIRDFRDGVWRNDNIPKEARVEARSRFLGIIGMTSIFAGVSGYPLIWGAEMIANNLLGDDDDPFDSKTESRRLVYNATREYIGDAWGQKVATAVMKGPWSAFTGADLSQRASLNNLWIREIPDRLKRDPKDLMLHLAGEALGPIFGVGMNFAGGIGDLQSDRPDRAIEKFMPKFGSDALKSVRYATKGAQTYQRDMIMSPKEFTSMDYFLQFTGFTPTRLADRYEQNRAIKDMEQRLRNYRSDLMNKLFMAWRIGDKSTAKETFRDIAEWNKKNPRYPISPEGLMQSARSRAQYDMRTVGGVAVDKRLQYLQNEMRFIERPKP